VRHLLWVDGVNSAVMAHLVLTEIPDAIPVHCDLGDSVHPDSRRFIDDLEKWYGKEIVRIKSEKYDTIDDVFERRKYLSGRNGAPCTGEMKIAPRLAFQLPNDLHIFGYTADAPDIERFNRLRESFFELQVRAPLIEKGITKAGAMAWVARDGLELPRTYAMGFPNANCMKTGCCKASSPNYWALFRKNFPERFQDTAERSRRLGARLTRIKGERMFIDEIPHDWPTLEPIAPECDFLCAATLGDI